jgi:orotidine-5'-phosphate decarboxylase
MANLRMPDPQTVHSSSLTPRDRLIIALDVPSAAEARKIVAAVGETTCFYKVGKQLFTAEGPQVVRDLVSEGKKVFLDLKYHDIPNTVAGAVGEAAKLGVDMLTVHASGGAAMLRAAVEAARARPGMALLAVTVLTSMTDEDLESIGVRDGAPSRMLAQVLRLATLAVGSGCQGVVASAHEARELRKGLGPECVKDFLLVTPGVRPAGSAVGDQARVVTPAAAIAAGATHIVVGRPITGAIDPTAAVRGILREIA